MLKIKILLGRRDCGCDCGCECRVCVCVSAHGDASRKRIFFSIRRKAVAYGDSSDTAATLPAPSATAEVAAFGALRPDHEIRSRRPSE